MKSICVYCGSSDKLCQDYTDVAYKMGQEIAKRKLVIIYGAGSTGLMGALANGALESGGEVIGVIPEIFHTQQLAHTQLTKLEIVQTMHQRKARMIELADAFLALPGGFGTFEELFEVLTWAQIGLHHKPIGLLNINEYYSPLLSAIELARKEGFIYNEHHDLFATASQPAELIEALLNHRHPQGLERWLTRDS